MSNVILVGLPGSGKSTIGRALARLTNREFTDLDELVEQRTGETPARFIELEGEASFREIEAEVAREAAQIRNSVIATGGGTVIDPISRWELWHSGAVVWLDAEDAILLGRISRSTDRPLSATMEALRARRHERTGFYAAADLTVRSDKPHEEIAQDIADWLKQNNPAASSRTLFRADVRRDHPMGPREARILLGSRLDSAALAGLVAGYSTGVPVVVVDENVAEKQPSLVDAYPAQRQLTINAGESSKRLSVAENLLDFAFSHGAERGDAWVAVGGGTTGDLVGTAAALYMRGAPLIQVPTTWLAMADAAIGGKVAVDLAEAKNTAGAFWPPVAVVADVAAIDTLPWDRRLDGMAECLKSGLIGDPWLWDLIARRGVSAMATGEDADLAARYAIIERSALLKLRYVDADPFERGVRRHLNLGHTIGHGLEIESGYTLPHGQAVVLGIRAVAHIAAGRGLASSGGGSPLADVIDDVLQTLGYQMQRAFNADLVAKALRGDKKSEQGKIRWILPVDVGEVVEADDVTAAEIDSALAHIQA